MSDDQSDGQKFVEQARKEVQDLLIQAQTEALYQAAVTARAEGMALRELVAEQRGLLDGLDDDTWPEDPNPEDPELG